MTHSTTAAVHFPQPSAPANSAEAMFWHASELDTAPNAAEVATQYKELRARGAQQMLVGLGGVALAVKISLASYAAAAPHGGFYWVMIGSITYGTFAFFRGLGRLLS